MVYPRNVGLSSLSDVRTIRYVFFSPPDPDPERRPPPHISGGFEGVDAQSVTYKLRVRTYMQTLNSHLVAIVKVSHVDQVL